MSAGQTLGFDLSGIPLRLHGVPERSARALCRDWAAFRSSVPPGAFLEVEIRSVPGVGPGQPAFDPKAMRSKLGRGRAAFRMPQGSVDLDAAGHARVELRDDLGSVEYFTLLNLLRAALAFCLPSRGGALVHAAALVIDGRAFALAGAEGSGKSTWARAGAAAGAHVVSDDLIVLDADGPAFALLGAPFRSTHDVSFRPGRWPLAALLFPRHGAEPSLASVPSLVAQGRIVANLPFVAEALDRDARIAAVVRRLAGAAPCLELTFPPDAGFVGLLRAL